MLIPKPHPANVREVCAQWWNDLADALWFRVQVAASLGALVAPNRCSRVVVEEVVVEILYRVDSENVPHFFVDRDVDPNFELSCAMPWPSVPPRKRAALRFGWRCVARAQERYAKPFVDRYRNGDTRLTRGHTVRIIAQEVVQKVWDSYVIFDLWVVHSRASPSELRRASEALEAVRKEVLVDLILSPLIEHTHGPKVVQEFLDMKLPAVVSRSLRADQVRSAIAARLTGGPDRQMRAESDLQTLPTTKRSDSRLILGPEPYGTLRAVEHYLQEEENEAKKDPILTSSPLELRWKLVPVAMAATTVATWALPLTLWSIVLVGIVLLTLMALALYPAKVLGWKIILRQTETVAAATFFGFGLFGIAYAVCALLSDDLGSNVSRLGYPFLVSAGVGIAGGILGDNPKGVARILAHIQLLLFLGGVIGLVAVLLRIERQTRRSE